MHWTERMLKLLDARNMSLAELSRLSGVSSKLIYKYSDGGKRGGAGVQNPRGDTLARIANTLGVSEPELRYGHDQPNSVQLKQIPLLRMNEIGTLRRGQEPMEAWDRVSLVSAPVSVSEKAIAVQLVDESCGPDFHAGNVVIIEPGVPPEPGRFVVAVIEGHPDGMFRRFRPTSFGNPDHFKLIATNPDFPEVIVDERHPGFVVGRATKHIRDI